MTYEELWRRLTPLYEVSEAKAIVRLVMETRCGLSLADMLCGKVEQLPAKSKQEIEHLFVQLEQGTPVQYALGEATFCGRQFAVAPGVLIPRPETEELCRWIKEQRTDRAHSLLDVGTGSGCIAVTLALDMPQLMEVTAWDISTEALAIARENARRLLADVDFQQCDALTPPDDHERWDIIVSNPPYVCVGEATDMAPHVLDHEPHLALFVPDDDPLRFYRTIGQYATNALRPGGSLFFELNPRYAQEVADMLLEMGMRNVELRKDEFGKTRMLSVSKEICIRRKQ